MLPYIADGRLEFVEELERRTVAPGCSQFCSQSGYHDQNRAAKLLSSNIGRARPNW